MSAVLIRATALVAGWQRPATAPLDFTLESAMALAQPGTLAQKRFREITYGTFGAGENAPVPMSNNGSTRTHGANITVSRP